MLTEKQAITAIFGANLRRIRQEQRLSQKALAGRIGVGETMIVDYEAGRKTPGIDKLVMLAGALDVSVTELLGAGGGTIEDRRFKRCVETANKLGYEVSLTEDNWHVLMDRHSERQQQITIAKYDFIFGIEALENYLLFTPRGRKLAADFLFGDEVNTE